MKIVHINWSLGTGGTETMLTDIANEQSKENEVWVLIVNDLIDPLVKSRLNDEVHFKCYKRKAGGRNPLPFFFLNIDLFKIKPDVIHCHFETVVDVIKYRNCPIIETLHSCLGSGKDSPKYNHICFISEAVRQYSLNQGYDGTVVYNGIKKEQIKQRPLNAEPNNPFKIVQVGRMQDIKGQYLLIEAINILSKENIVNCSVDFIGAGEEENYLLELINKYKLGDRVNLLGLKDRDYVYSHLCEYDALVLPSTNEGFGLTLAEGIAAGLHVISTDLPGPMEVIGNGKYGLSFKSGDSHDLAKTIKMLLTGTAKDYRKEAMAYLDSNFTIAATSKNYINVYKTLTKANC